MKGRLLIPALAVLLVLGAGVASAAPIVCTGAPGVNGCTLILNGGPAVCNITINVLASASTGCAAWAQIATDLNTAGCCCGTCWGCTTGSTSGDACFASADGCVPNWTLSGSCFDNGNCTFNTPCS